MGAIPAPESVDTIVQPTGADREPTIAYCVAYADAEALIAEMLRDAAGRPLVLDLETAPTEAAAEQLKTLVEQRGALMAEIKAAKKAKAPSDAIEPLKAEAALLATRIKYAMSAGFDPHRSRIRLSQLYGGGDRIAVIDVFQAGALALHLLKGLDVVAHHAAFELICLEAAGVDLGEVHCTMQAARLTCGERAMGLSDAVKAHLGITLDKDLQASDWSRPQLDQAQLAYAAKDVVALWRLAEAIFPTLGPQTQAYEIQIGCTPAAARMRHRGILLDLEAHAGLMQSLKAKRVETCAAYAWACEDMGLPELAAKVASTPAEKRIAL
ncbi:MAG: hypothetical protein WA397_09650 [Roseiarcus sp.]